MKNICIYFEFQNRTALQIGTVQVFEDTASEQIAAGKNYITTYSKIYKLDRIGHKIEAYLVKQYKPIYGIGIEKRGYHHFATFEHVKRFF